MSKCEKGRQSYVFHYWGSEEMFTLKHHTYLLSMSALHLGDSSSNDLVNFTTWTFGEWKKWPERLEELHGGTQCSVVKHAHSQIYRHIHTAEEKQSYRWRNVLQQLNRAALALKQRLGTVHDLPDNLFQVSLLFKQVIDHLQQGLNTSDRKDTTAIIPSNRNIQKNAFPW